MAKITVLGAGPAGLAAAFELAQRGVEVTLIERNTTVGGNAGSFQFGGINVDYGSHRLHPASDPKVLGKIKELLGDDLLTRPRHGRIHLLGRWIHFPLRPTDILFKGNPRFTLGVMADLIKKIIPAKKTDGAENFATVLSSGLGKTICNEFYFPYARKIWGLDPQELSAAQAYKRISAGTIGKMIKRLMPWNKRSGGANTKGIFHYPKHGFGQICEAYLAAAERAGVKVMCSSDIQSITLSESNQQVVLKNAGKEFEIHSDQIFSTIPLTTLSQLVQIDTPDEVVKASEKLEFRSMVLVYIELAQNQFTEYDAHYFPGANIPFTRISEPKNYSASSQTDSTVLCAEVPCFYADKIWQSSDTELSTMVIDGLAQVGLPVTAELLQVTTKKLRFAYPLYKDGYEELFETIDDWIESLEGVLTFGRQGLYAHDNTHHAIFMALKAVDCLDSEGQFNKEKWIAARDIFKTHVVED